MAIKEINIDDWFNSEVFADEFDEDKEQIEYEKEFAKTWAEIKSLAQTCLTEIDRKPKDDKVLMSSLSKFYEAWKKNDEASDSEIRDQVAEFVREVIAKSESKMHPHDAFYDILFGHVNIKIYSQGDLKKPVSDKEILLASAWIERSLAEHLQADLPGLITIKIFKPRTGAEIPKDFLIHSSFSLMIKDFNENTMVDILDFDEDLTKPSKEELKAAQKLSQSLLETLNKGIAPIKIEGIGTFQFDELPGYEGRNPRTREVIQVPGRKIIVYRMDRSLKERLTKVIVK